jgi:hypothetical protein
MFKKEFKFQVEKNNTQTVFSLCGFIFGTDPSVWRADQIKK